METGKREAPAGGYVSILDPATRPDPALLHDLEWRANGANIHRIANLRSTYCGLCDLLRLVRESDGDGYTMAMLESEIHFAEVRARAFLRSISFGPHPGA